MKILKGIITGVGVLAALLCALIILSAVNPGITEGLSSLLSGDGFSSEKEEEEGQESDGGEDNTEETLSSRIERGFADTADIPALDMEEEEEPEEPVETVARQPDSPVRESSEKQSLDEDSSEKTVRGMNGYEPPSQSNVKVPEAVSGKSGYEPITENAEEVEETEDGEYVSDLGYGETGDGFLFDSTFYPYYHMLDEKGQHLYRQICANADAMNAAFEPIETVTVPEIKNVLMAVYNDHPELFWLNTIFTCKYDKNKICVELTLDFNMTEDERIRSYRNFYNMTNSILSEVENLGTYERERRLHDILIQRIEYDGGADMNQSAYSALVEGKSVCAGYARAYQYLMQRLGIPCYYCTGYAGEEHAWNIVALDDGYYNVDLTWDDTPGGEYDYFNKTDEDYADTHIRQDLSINLPQCQGQRYRSQ
ncbi:MAG: hypothetical protein K1W20_08140 [Lachnospiraceae bacterium]|nr:hypothetical protein [Lachnospiraceae bacterium]